MTGRRRDDHNDIDDAFLAQFTCPPRAAFADALYARLAREEAVVSQAPRRLFPARLPRLAYAAIIVLALLGVATGGTALARRATLLPHSTPLEIAPATPGGTPSLSATGRTTYEPAPTGRRWAAVGDLAVKVGLPLLVPTYLPPGCEERERFGYGTPVHVAYRAYSCVTLSQQAVVRDGVAHDERPQVGEGAIEDVMIDGQPAYFIHGAWLTDAQGRSVWQAGRGVMLVLERDGLLIRLQEENLGLQPEAELVRIAASLRQDH